MFVKYYWLCPKGKRPKCFKEKMVLFVCYCLLNKKTFIETQKQGKGL